VSTHNPRQVIEDLRSHLAAPDRRLIFLLGAGASGAVNIAPIESSPSSEKPKHVPLIPGINGLTEECAAAVKSMGKPQAEAWDKLSQQCEKESRSSNVENILSKVRMKIDAISEEEMLVGLSRKQLAEVEENICKTIAKTVCPDEDKIPEKIPHDLFADWVKKANRTIPLEIFTTNYDVLLERSFEASRIPVFDGFVAFFMQWGGIFIDARQPDLNWLCGFSKGGRSYNPPL
jgi:hypothetical protein